MSGISVHYDCKVGTRQILLGKSFPGMFTAPDTLENHILLRMLPRADEVLDVLPQICIATHGFETQPGILTGLDDIGYPVAVVIIAASKLDFVTNEEQYLGWRQTIFRALRQQSMNAQPGCSTVYNAIATPFNITDPNAFNMGYFYSGIVFHYISREPRG